MGMTRLGSSLSVFNFMTLGSSLSLRSYARLGSSLSVYAITKLANKQTVRWTEAAKREQSRALRVKLWNSL